MRSNFYGYALGLEARDYRGKLMLTHTGGLPGYVSRVALIPELRLGVAVLTNQESGYAFNSVAYRVLDHYLGAKAPDYIGAYLQAGETRRARRRRSSPTLRRPATRPRGRHSRFSSMPEDTGTTGTAT